jgi:hypothetical protein
MSFLTICSIVHCECARRHDLVYTYAAGGAVPDKWYHSGFTGNGALGLMVRATMSDTGKLCARLRRTRGCQRWLHLRWDHSLRGVTLQSICPQQHDHTMHLTMQGTCWPYSDHRSTVFPSHWPCVPNAGSCRSVSCPASLKLHCTDDTNP